MIKRFNTFSIALITTALLQGCDKGIKVIDFQTQSATGLTATPTPTPAPTMTPVPTPQPSPTPVACSCNGVNNLGQAVYSDVCGSTTCGTDNNIWTCGTSGYTGPGASCAVATPTPTPPASSPTPVPTPAPTPPTGGNSVYPSPITTVLSVPPYIIQIGHQNDLLVHAGYLDVTLYGADPSGVNDSTTAIQNAIDDGTNYAMAAYVPSGTYKISNTLRGIQPLSSSCYAEVGIGGFWRGNYAKAPSLVGPASGPRPLIKLANSSSGFNDVNNPKPMVHLLNNGIDPTTGQVHTAYERFERKAGGFDCFFYGVIRNVDFEVGSGNSGAIGVQFYAAQYSYMQDVKVNMPNGGYAGFEGAPLTSNWSNLEANGGRYGVILNAACGNTTIAGLKLTNQTVAGLSTVEYCGSAVITGFEISSNSAIGIDVGHSTYWDAHTGSMSLLDGSITNGSAPAIQNNPNTSMHFKNVYAKTNASVPLITIGGSSVMSSNGNFTRINEYAHGNPSTVAEPLPKFEVIVINGVQTSGDFVDVQTNAGNPPTDFILRHSPGNSPWIMDSGVAFVTAYGADPTGATDSTQAIQNAINARDIVFIPRGDFVISGTLNLRPNTKLFGVPGSRSRLLAPDWNPGTTFQPFIRTANDANGRTYVGDIMPVLDTSRTGWGAGAGYYSSYLTGIEWRVGRNSVMNQVYVQPAYVGGDRTSAPRKLVHFKDNGGGRIYGFESHVVGNATLTLNPNTRALYIEGTSQPMSFYGPNPEHFDQLFYEVQNASNIRFLGMKVETVTPILKVNNSSNIMFTGLTGHNYFSGTPRLEFTNSSNICLSGLGYYGGNHDQPFIKFDSVNYSSTNHYSLFASGTFNLNAFPYCGDNICDVAENASNCSADCN